MGASTGELVKLYIKAFEDEKYQNPVKPEEEFQFTTLINPEKFTINYKVENDSKQAQGTSGVSSKFTKIPPQTLEIEFLFDSTGVINSNIKTEAIRDETKEGIVDAIETFKKVTYSYSGENHKPNFIVLHWGVLLFKGITEEVNIEFKLFHPNGIPLRAVAKAKFIGYIENNLRVAKEYKRSPDLTHIRTIKLGDTLPLMCNDIYGDSKYYLEVAKANNLVNYRKLKPGMQLFFPPLSKVN